jgi:hypothetical protein
MGTSNGFITITVGGPAFQAQCSNGQWALFGYGLSLSVTVGLSSSTATFTNPPMAETIQDSVTGNFAMINWNFYVNGQPQPVTAQSVFNIATKFTSGIFIIYSIYLLYLSIYPNL